MKKFKRTAQDAAAPIVKTCTLDVRRVWEAHEIKRSLVRAIERTGEVLPTACNANSANR